ncbi:MAG: outer membrane beta-barrel protein [Bacteroidetes bacterium]|nr:outer membrane beta-barrel protein [Bacteroidota bacterium]
MKKYFFILLIILIASGSPVLAQFPQMGAGGFDPSKMNIGRLYGKIVDEDGGGVAFASVQVHGKKFNPADFSLKDSIFAGQLSQSNGDFEFKNLPVVGEYTLVISFLGYAEIRQKVDFGMPMPMGRPNGMQPGKTDSTAKENKTTPPQGQFPSGGMPKIESNKDLGNIQLQAQDVTLDAVEIQAEASVAKLAIDRKVFRIDKDLTTAGGTAQDALRNVPSLSVDLDGNVSLRNGSPQIFIDGRPSTLSLDQIPADAIESVEVLTNPSAKFDAGGGSAGIVNIVMKKERRIGYNGNVRLGGDSQQGLNFGGDINARGEKINVFASTMIMRNRGQGEAETFRQNLFGDPLTNITQTTANQMEGMFANGRAGIDFFLSNRNTLTVSGMYMRGKFNPVDELTTMTDFLYQYDTISSSYVRTSVPDRNFRNKGVSVQFKHLFPRNGAEWTADANYNQVRFEGGNQYNTIYETGLESMEKQDGLGQGSFLTLQTDLVYPLTNGIKLEAGLKSTMRDNSNNTLSYVLSNDEWVRIPQLADYYEYDDDVYAAYIQGSKSTDKWGFQAGLRAESSFYEGRLPEVDSSFAINYPLSLFPSVFLTRKLKGSSELQLAYTRRVNRPNFFQTMPFVDFSDSLNLRKGNPTLLPEFSNSLELSYQKMFGKNHTLIASVYYKQATNVITSYQYNEYNETMGKEVVITSFINSNQAYAYGTELTVRNSFFGWLDLTTNLNIFQATVNADNLQDGLQINRLSGFLKETVQIRLPGSFSLQVNGEYRTKASFTPSNNNNMFGPPMSQNSAQGYTLAYWVMDASLRKDFFDRKLSLTLSAQDIFATRRMGSYTETDFFIQESSRVMNQQQIRLNLSYRFGKMDASLFQRKNNRMNNQGSDMMMQ